MRRALPLILALVAVLWLTPAVAGAQATPLDEAVAAYEAGDIEAALGAFERAQQSSSTGPAELHRIHLYLGIIHAVIGDTDAARRNFAIALAIDPNTDAPAELAPDQRQIFEDVRSEVHRMELAVEPVGASSNLAASTLRLRVRYAPSGLVSRFRARATPAAGGQAWSATVDASDPSELAIPAMAWRAAERLDVTVEALNVHGGVLVTTQLQLTHMATGDGSPETLLVEDTPSTGGGSVVEEAWFWVVIGVIVAGGVAAGVGLALTLGPETYLLDAPTIQR